LGGILLRFASLLRAEFIIAALQRDKKLKK